MKSKDKAGGDRRATQKDEPRGTMSILPSNLARVPNILTSRITLANIARTNVDLLTTQSQIATGRDIARPSDDIVRAATIANLDDRLERSTQLSRNLTHAESALNVLDNIFDESNQLALQGKSIAAAQLNFTTSAAERQGQAVVVDQLLQSLYNTANRQSVAGYALGGGRTETPPIQEFLGGYRYVGEGAGITTDLGLAARVPITMGGGNPVTARSARVKGDVDLNPVLTTDTRLADVKGARGLGVTLGEIEFSFVGGPRTKVDLTGADSVKDVQAKLTSAIKKYETDNSVTILGPGGVTVGAGGLAINVAATPVTVPPTPTPSLQFYDIGSGVAAQDLGLASTTAASPIIFTSAATAGADVNPKLTWRTPVVAMTGVTTPPGLGSIKLNNLGRTATVDLSGAVTLGDVKNLIETTNLGVRVAINADGTGIDVLNDVSAARKNSLSIEEVPGSGYTASRLGIRSLTDTTSIDDFNYGRGVQIVDGRKNPISGVVDPTLNTDFQIVLGDAAGTVINVDLRPQDMATVRTVLDRINAEAAPALAAAGLAPGDLVAGLTDGTNGITLQQNAAFPNAVRVQAINNSPAAEQLGLVGGTYNTTTKQLVAQDTAKVRVDSLFTHLSDLRDALAADDTAGIQLAGESLERSIGALGETRGLVGGLARRVDDASAREDDRRVIDEQVRSQLRDTDFTKAASKFTLLQTQLEAGLRVAASTQQQSLLNFLG